MVFCTECRKENPNGPKFCYNCGAKLTHDDVVEDINRQTYGNSNENVNYQYAEKQSDKINHENQNKNVNHQHTEYDEKPLIKRNKSQKKFKHILISIFDAITKYLPYSVFVIFAGYIISGIIYFIDQQLSHIIWLASGFSIIIITILCIVPSAISNRLKRSLR